MVNPRLNRLRKDYERLRELDQRSRFVQILQTEGNPPEKYVLGLTCKGVTHVDGSGRPVYSQNHRLEILLHDEYPQRKPEFTMQTPIWHPNVARNGTVCIGDEGDHGWAPGIGLDDVMIRIIEIIRYENWNAHSAYNLEAGQWALRHSNLFPLETEQIVQEDLIEISILDDIQLITPDLTAGDLDIKIF